MSSFIGSALLILIAFFVRQSHRNARTQQIAALNVRSFFLQLSQQLAQPTTGSMGQLADYLRPTPHGEIVRILDAMRISYERNESCSELFKKLAKFNKTIRPKFEDYNTASKETKVYLQMQCKYYKNMDKLVFDAVVKRNTTILHCLQTDITYPFGKEATSLAIELNTKLSYLRNVYMTICQQTDRLIIRMRVSECDAAVCTHMALELHEISRQSILQYDLVADIWTAVDEILARSTFRLACANIIQFWKSVFWNL